MAKLSTWNLHSTLSSVMNLGDRQSFLNILILVESQILRQEPILETMLEKNILDYIFMGSDQRPLDQALYVFHTYFRISRYPIFNS